MFKGDIQATRSTAAAGASAIIAQPIRLKGIIVASDGGGAGVLELTTTSNSGDTMFIADVPTGDLVNFSFSVSDSTFFSTGVSVLSSVTSISGFSVLSSSGLSCPV